MPDISQRERELLGNLSDMRRRISREETMEFDSGGGSAIDTFLELTDTPSAYVGAANYFVRVNSGTTALTFGTVDWTDIYGKPSTFAPSAHGSSHHFGSADPVGTATPTANAIPYADGSGLLDSWISLAGTATPGRAAFNSGDFIVNGGTAALGTTVPRYSGVPTAGAVAYWTGAGTVAAAGFGTADVATLAGTQTLTNKTIDASNNTLTNVNTSALANNAVTNAILADMAQATVKGRQAAAGTGDPEDLTAAQLATILQTAQVTTSTYTPAITGGGTNPTVTYTEQVGKYTTLFNALCFFSFQITIASISGGSGELRISIPVTSANTNTADGTRNAASFSGVDITAVGPYNLHFRVTPGQAYGSFRVGGDNIASTIPQIGDFATGDTIAASGFFWL